jgi:hypothetical protein
MTSKRLNLVVSVRLALIDMGVSSVRVVNAINGVIGEAKLEKHTSKLGAGTVSKRGYSVTEAENKKWVLPRCIVTTFDSWHSAIERADKIAPMTEATAIPVLFHEWLKKFGATTEETNKEQEEIKSILA